ncbi:MAG: BlaI/MecI/CopY family transcriptional regulator [Firmicutes bacterium]|nr:BlaI/MecI/CopY family transcriptional regulator [Bacillota bacterium]
MKKGVELHQAEYKFMEVIWANEPVNSTALVKLCDEQLGWKKSTTYTVLRKLCQRGILRNDDATVVAVAKREQVQKFESQQVVERSFGGSLPAFVNAFLSEKKLSREEAEELKKLIEEASR